MHKRSHRKPLTLDTTTVKSLSADALIKAAGAWDYNGSQNVGCYFSGATLCPLCYRP